MSPRNDVFLKRRHQLTHNKPAISWSKLQPLSFASSTVNLTFIHSVIRPTPSSKMFIQFLFPLELVTSCSL
ncbi:hypothetical protein CSKR_110472 [Clonorchis sinensis]|uniref:Uncharacterized protein n=2 Tax=Clonorchis sinensis TaxID=79923 RepID=G7YU25_CLOSI|nr:hypothetical protein CSKR_110472 [Clonorchis sinensis]GAA56455.1 hypothetical protein CLF_110926 [Clonorchis sinensis]